MISVLAKPAFQKTSLVLGLGEWRSQITSQSVVGSLQALSAKYGIHVLFADNRELTAKTVEGLLFHFLRKQYEYYERLKPLLLLEGRGKA